MLQRLALYTALGLTLSAVEADFTHWAFWCTVGLFWASETLTRREGFEVGVTQGMTVYSQATDEQRAAIDKIIKDTAND
jgi:hypothetical protein